MDLIVPDSLPAVFDFAHAASAAGYYKCSPPQAAMKIMTGNALGIPPTAALTGIHIVEGKPSFSSGLIGALIKRSGRYDYRVKRKDDEGCVLRWFETVDGKREELGESRFTIEQARTAGLVKPKSGWAKYPEDMCFARALTRGARTFCPEVFLGAVYGEGEVQEAREPVQLEPQRDAKPANVAPAQGQPDVLDAEFQVTGLTERKAKLRELASSLPSDKAKAALAAIGAAETGARLDQIEARIGQRLSEDTSSEQQPGGSPGALPNQAAVQGPAPSASAQRVNGSECQDGTDGPGEGVTKASLAADPQPGPEDRPGEGENKWAQRAAEADAEHIDEVQARIDKLLALTAHWPEGSRLGVAAEIERTKGDPDRFAKFEADTVQQLEDEKSGGDA